MCAYPIQTEETRAVEVQSGYMSILGWCNKVSRAAALGSEWRAFRYLCDAPVLVMSPAGRQSCRDRYLWLVG